MNQKSVLEIVDLLVETHVASCVHQATLVHEVFAAWSRMGMMQDVQREIAVVLPMLETSLHTLYHHECKKDDEYNVEQFWKRYKVTASLFLNVASVEKVLAEKNDWANVSYELSSLSTGSQLGVELFLRFCPALVLSTVNKFMKLEAMNFAKGLGEITSQSLSKLTQTMIDEATRLSMDKLLNGADFEVDFLGCVLVVRAHTSLELARYHVAAMVKTLAVQSGGLQQLDMEREIRGPANVDLEGRKFQAEVVKPYIEVRQLMNALLAKAEFTSPKEVGDFMESKRTLWFNVDPTFSLEVFYMKALSGKAGGDFLVAQATGPFRMACRPRTLVSV
jgi:hypothetical protein